jgi:hypothetical protein
MYLQAPGTKEHITVMACFNAAGKDVAPFINITRALYFTSSMGRRATWTRSCSWRL